MSGSPAHVNPEFTLRALLMGTLLGILFGASSLYLVLKVGLTVSASIPVAVIGIALFRLGNRFGWRDSSLHENNIVQTAGSAGESIAFGLGVTMPAILILGFDLEIWRVMLVGTLGALLGILMMIPLRHTLIVQMRDTLKYPEGTACAQVLLANEQAKAAHAAGNATDRRAHLIFLGFFIGLGYKITNVALKAWKEVPQAVFGAPLKSGSVAAEISPELLGVGYIIGPRIAATMCAGGVLSWLLFIPMISFFGAGLDAPLFPGTKPIGTMTPAEIRSAYILYLGAGAVATGGLIALLRALPTIWRSIRGTLSRLSPRTPHTEQDIPLRWVLIGCIAILAIITLAEPLHMNLAGALLILLFGFLFVTVSSRLAGEIGMTTNPISGMTVATLLFTSALFLLVGWTGSTYYVTALSVGAIVSIAACNAGATSQDLKTGYLVGATPRLQQYAILIGAFATALALGPILLKLNDTGTVHVQLQNPAIRIPAETAQTLPREQLPDWQHGGDTNTYRVWFNTDATRAATGKYLLTESGEAAYYVDPGINGTHTTRPDGTEAPKFDAPKAVLMSYVIKGMLDRKLPWELVLLGAMLALILEMARVPSLPFAVGVYLPLASSLPIFIGGALRWLVDRRNHPGMEEEQRFAQGDHGPGVLLASGYIAGGALAGIVIAFSTGVLGDVSAALMQFMRAHNPFYAGAHADLLALIPFGLLVWLLWRKGRAETGER
jgi:putative OPT family oligopeptide transporter